MAAGGKYDLSSEEGFLSCFHDQLAELEQFGLTLRLQGSQPTAGVPATAEHTSHHGTDDREGARAGVSLQGTLRYEGGSVLARAPLRELVSQWERCFGAQIERLMARDASLFREASRLPEELRDVIDLAAVAGLEENARWRVWVWVTNLTKLSIGVVQGPEAYRRIPRQSVPSLSGALAHPRGAGGLKQETHQASDHSAAHSSQGSRPSHTSQAAQAGGPEPLSSAADCSNDDEETLLTDDLENTEAWRRLLCIAKEEKLSPVVPDFFLIILKNIPRHKMLKVQRIMFRLNDRFTEKEKGDMVPTMNLVVANLFKQMKSSELGPTFSPGENRGVDCEDEDDTAFAEDEDSVTGMAGFFAAETLGLDANAMGFNAHGKKAPCDPHLAELVKELVGVAVDIARELIASSTINECVARLMREHHNGLAPGTIIVDIFNKAPVLIRRFSNEIGSDGEQSKQERSRSGALSVLFNAILPNTFTNDAGLSRKETGQPQKRSAQTHNTEARNTLASNNVRVDDTSSYEYPNGAMEWVKQYLSSC